MPATPDVPPSAVEFPTQRTPPPAAAPSEPVVVSLVERFGEVLTYLIMIVVSSVGVGAVAFAIATGVGLSRWVVGLLP